MINDQWKYCWDIRATVQATLDTLKNEMPPLERGLTEIKIPTLVMMAKKDTLVPL